MSRHTSTDKHNRQVPRGKKRPRGYGERVASAEEIMERLRVHPPRSSRRAAPARPPRRAAPGR